MKTEELLRQELKRKKLIHAQIAKKIGIRRQCFWEKLKHPERFTIYEFARLADILEISMRELVGDMPEMKERDKGE